MAASILKSALLALLASVALTNAAAATTTAEATETDPTANEDPSADSERGTRYCEVIPCSALAYSQKECKNKTIEIDVTLREVYNTQGFSDCPQDIWVTITNETVNAEFGSYYADINGPRWWAMDAKQAMGGSAGGPTYNFSGLMMQRRAMILQPPAQAKAAIYAPPKYYSPNTIQRDTVFIYYQGSQVYLLTDPDDKVYMMQSYTTMVNPNVTIDTLPELGSMLDLPKGWTYTVETLEEQYNLKTEDNIAYVIQDNLKNSYQMQTASSTYGTE